FSPATTTDFWNRK
ncbi:biotin-requiring enzyme family protein, partial [Chlamydia psittaci 84-8471/1]